MTQQMSDAPLDCPLCTGSAAGRFAEVGARRYLRCPTCLLTFLHPADRLSPVEERARYETHENDPADRRYRAFLDRLAVPLAERLTEGMHGLDFGSGPGPTLSVMMEERGFFMSLYDPFFAPDRAVLERHYDFVTCTETAEHFFHPGEDFHRLSTLLRSPGWLGIMTQRMDDDGGFPDWWYARDPTHVAFYRTETLEWIAQAYGWILETPSETVAIFHRTAES
jgi:hypothetical protein